MLYRYRDSGIQKYRFTDRVSQINIYKDKEIQLYTDKEIYRYRDTEIQPFEFGPYEVLHYALVVAVVVVVAVLVAAVACVVASAYSPVF